MCSVLEPVMQCLSAVVGNAAVQYVEKHILKAVHVQRHLWEIQEALIDKNSDITKSCSLTLYMINT